MLSESVLFLATTCTLSEFWMGCFMFSICILYFEDVMISFLVIPFNCVFEALMFRSLSRLCNHNEGMVGCTLGFFVRFSQLANICFLMSGAG